MASRKTTGRRALAALVAGAGLCLAGGAGAETVAGYTLVSGVRPERGEVTLLDGPCRVGPGTTLRRVTGHIVTLGELAAEVAEQSLPAQYEADRGPAGCSLRTLKIVDAIPD